jgi:hypothetical protein
MNIEAGVHALYNFGRVYKKIEIKHKDGSFESHDFDPGRLHGVETDLFRVLGLSNKEADSVKLLVQTFSNVSSVEEIEGGIRIICNESEPKTDHEEINSELRIVPVNMKLPEYVDLLT